MPGTVTNPTGNVDGNDLTKLRGAYTGHFSGLLCPVGAAQAQIQQAAMLSSETDPCGSGSPYVGGELTVRIVPWAYADLPDCVTVYPPTEALPLTFQVPDVVVDTTDGVHRFVRVAFMKARNNGGAGSDVWATGGTVTFTRMDSTAYEGSYDLTFANGSAAGSFVAPWCGTAP